ncbi:exosortase N [Emticicia sp. 17c]|uniref:exosortase N n=1 Tax=Emticicia sp. 17c TaxID=3127704 RepID=UPI00301C29AF
MITLNSIKNIRTVISFILIYLALFSFQAYKGYFLGDSVFLIGIGLLFYMIKTGFSDNRSYRFLFPTLVVAILAFYIPASSIRYILLVFALLFCYESLVGKVSGLVLVTLLLISPLFRYAAETFTFPIRIWLSKISGQLLKAMNFPIEIQGNVVLINGNDFLVDAACTGLQMIGFSFLLSIFLMTYYQNLFQKKLAFYWQILILSFTFLLNIFSNLCRIIILIVFKILPDHIMHEVIGLICLLLYVWLPVIALTKFVIKRQKHSNRQLYITADNKRHLHWLVNTLVLMISVYLVVFFSDTEKRINVGSIQLRNKAGYQTKLLSTGITQLKNAKALVYLKPIPDFYSSDHSPVVCWTGSGYEFKKIKEESVGQYHIYTGILENKQDKLYTAWWFSDGETTTISQLEWRWKAFKGTRRFELVNVTASTEDELKHTIAEWL